MLAAQKDFSTLTIVDIRQDSFASSERLLEDHQSEKSLETDETIPAEHWSQVDALIKGWDACDSPSFRPARNVEGDDQMVTAAIIESDFEPLRRLSAKLISSVLPTPAKFQRSEKRNGNVLI